MKWFRVYNEIVDDPKLRLLAFEDRWHFVALLAMKAQGVLEQQEPGLLDRMVAVKLGLQVQDVDEVRKRLMELSLITPDWQPANWSKRQFESDNSTERVRKYRNQNKKGTSKVSETLPKRFGNVLDTDTDTDSEGTRTAPSGAACDGFAEIRSAYPAREGSQRWADAQKSYKARIREGSTHADILAGVQRYAAYCKAKDVTGTAMVQQAATFLGLNKGFSETWEVRQEGAATGFAQYRRPLSAAERVRRANPEAFDDFIEGCVTQIGAAP